MTAMAKSNVSPCLSLTIWTRNFLKVKSVLPACLCFVPVESREFQA